MARPRARPAPDAARAAGGAAPRSRRVDECCTIGAVPTGTTNIVRRIPSMRSRRPPLVQGRGDVVGLQARNPGREGQVHARRVRRVHGDEVVGHRLDAPRRRRRGQTDAARRAARDARPPRPIAPAQAVSRAPSRAWLPPFRPAGEPRLNGCDSGGRIHSGGARVSAMTRRAKIVCTLGPATSSEEAIGGLIDAGMNVARMNFSHGDYADHQVIYERVRAAAKATDKALGVLADLQGPKIRLGRFTDGPHDWDDRRPGDDHRGRRRRHQGPGVHHLQGSGPGRPPRRPAADRRRQGRPRRHPGRRQRCRVLGHRGRPGLQQQGHLAARHERVGPGDVREGHRRPEVRAVPRRRRRSRCRSSARRPTSTWCTT